MNITGEDLVLDCLCHPESCPFPVEFTQMNISVSYSDSLDSFNDMVAEMCEKINTPYEIVPFWGRAILITIYTVTILLSILGNVTVISVLGCGRNSRKELNRYLVNLAVSDLSMAIFCMPFSFIQGMLRRWIFGEVMCPIVLFAQQVSVTLSIFTLTAIGIDRCIAVRRPLQNHAAKPRSKYIIPIIWLTSLSLGITPIVKGKAVLMPEVTDQYYYQCMERWENRTQELAYDYFLMIVTYVIPLIILCVTYTLIGKNVWNRKIPGASERTMTDVQLVTRKKSLIHSPGDRGRMHYTLDTGNYVLLSNLKEQKMYITENLSVTLKIKKVIRMLLIVVLAFALCWLPLQLFVIVTTLDTQYLDNTTSHKTTITVYLTFHWLAMANSFMNPIIYSFNDSFRDEFMYTLYKLRRRGRRTSGQRMRWKISFSTGQSSRRSNTTIAMTVNN
ncbi:QRFP-like peptide receptor [Glandiceps talaboti]